MINMEKEIINYNDYLKSKEKTANTNDYPVPDSAAGMQPGDKIVSFMKSQFSSQVPYFTMGIRSTNTDLTKYSHTREF